MQYGDRFLAIVGAVVSGIVFVTMGALVLRNNGGAASAIINAGGGSTAQVLNAVANVAGGAA